MKSAKMRRMAEPLASRLGYLLKHTQQGFAEAGARALAPLGITGRQLAVLAVLGDAEPLSQLEAATELGVDRTTMVQLVDELEGKGLVARRRSAQDRRKNIVELTERGQAVLREGDEIHRAAEVLFMERLTPVEAELFVRILQRLNGIDVPE
jgi:DNA-binding MarR family transcriptional regulator